MSAAELRAKVCFNKRFSLAEGAVSLSSSKTRTEGAHRDSPGMESLNVEVGTYKSVNNVVGSNCYVKVLHEANACGFKSSQPGCQLRRAAEDSNRFYALPLRPDSPKRSENACLPA
jgi:hypothetical protein